jgi:hypothetical protein
VIPGAVGRQKSTKYKAQLTDHSLKETRKQLVRFGRLPTHGCLPVKRSTSDNAVFKSDWTMGYSYLLATLALPGLFFIGFPQQSKTLSSSTTIPPTSSTTTDSPHTSHTMDSPLFTRFLVAAFDFSVFTLLDAVFSAMFFSFCKLGIVLLAKL